jgi:hypothetical protein
MIVRQESGIARSNRRTTTDNRPQIAARRRRIGLHSTVRRVDFAKDEGLRSALPMNN